MGTGPYLSPFLSRIQFLLDLLQRRVPAWRNGGVELALAIKRRGPEDDLEGLAGCPLIQLYHLHVFDNAQVQVHHTCTGNEQKRNMG